MPSQEHSCSPSESLRICVHICNAAHKCCYGRGSLYLKQAEAQWQWTLGKGHRGEGGCPFLRGHKGNRKKMSSNTRSDKGVSPYPWPWRFCWRQGGNYHFSEAVAPGSCIPQGKGTARLFPESPAPGKWLLKAAMSDSSVCVLPASAHHMTIWNTSEPMKPGRGTARSSTLDVENKKCPSSMCMWEQ